MRKVIVLEHLSLDGVIQAASGPQEDTSGGFAYGGWIAPYSDEVLGTALRKQMNLPFDLLLGRTTFEIWEPYWPHHGDIWPGANTATKYVASNSRTASDWQTSVFLNGDIAQKVAAIKQEPGPDLHVWGSGNLLQTLIKHDLVDTFWLMIYPVTLGSGKRLFADGTIPAAFQVTEGTVTPSGVIVVNYAGRRAYNRQFLKLSDYSPNHTEEFHMKRVTGIGGIFFKAKDAPALQAWYKRHLGIDVQEWGGTAFTWTDTDGKPTGGTTIWSVGPAEGDQFAPSKAAFMINYRVDDLDALVTALKAEGCDVLDQSDDATYGKFAWVIDPEGNKVELWQPPAGQ